MKRIIVAGLFGLALLAPALAAPAFAQGFDVPDGFRSRPGAATNSPDWTPLLTVTPDEGPFSELSEIVLARVAAPVADPDAWLAARLTAEVTAPGEIERLLDSPDSPFGDPAFDVLRRALPELFAGLQTMGRLPLEFCDPPRAGYNASGAFRERYCTFAIGPLRKFVVLRLQQAGDDWYYTQITAMNERRLRHLTAIANSFAAGR
jgi:hypothetical protein